MVFAIFSFDRHFQAHKNLRTKKEAFNDSNFVVTNFEKPLSEQQNNTEGFDIFSAQIGLCYVSFLTTVLLTNFPCVGSYYDLSMVCPMTIIYT